jgi:hypothetical protein
LEAALGILSIGGVVVLHDANRRYYSEPFRLYKFQLLFRDSRITEGGLFIGSNNLDVSAILNINKHKLNWRMLESVSKLEEVIIDSFIRKTKRPKLRANKR